MRFSKTKAIVMSAVVTLLCVGLIVAATFALFSASRSTSVHLSAGKLDAGLYLTARDGVEIGTDGRFVDVASPEQPVNLEDDGSAIFSFEKVVPTMWQSATLRVTNNGSTVAFNYSVSVVGIEANEAATDAGLLSRLRVTVTDSQKKETTFTLADAGTKGQNIDLGTVAATANAYGEFTVRVEFLNNADGTIEDSSDFAGATVDFDLTVECVQVTATPTE